MRFGPDVEWIPQENYDVDPNRAAAFYQRIRDYWPPAGQRAFAGLLGIRPKLTGQGEAAADPHDRRPPARRAAPRPAVRDRVARADGFAVDCGGWSPVWRTDAGAARYLAACTRLFLLPRVVAVSPWLAAAGGGGAGVASAGSILVPVSLRRSSDDKPE